MPSSRRNSRSRSRSRRGASGLPLPSTLRASDRGKLAQDKKGTIKILKGSGRKLVWKNPTKRDIQQYQILKPMSRTRENYYYKRVDNAIGNEKTLRDILAQALKEIQPPKSAFIK